MENILQQVKSSSNPKNQMLKHLLSTVDKHDLKSKPSYKGSKPANGWALHTDTDTYPILKSANEKDFHWNRFLTKLSDIKMESDKLNDIQTFWNNINTAFYSLLATNKKIGLYKEFTRYHNTKEHTTPPVGHTQYNMGQAVNAYFYRIIKDHLTKKNEIDCDKSQKGIQGIQDILTPTNTRR